MERYEDHTIAHAIQAKYEKTKVKTHLCILVLFLFICGFAATYVDMVAACVC